VRTAATDLLTLEATGASVMHRDNVWRNIAANEPVFAGLYGVQFCRSNYVDPDTLRCSARGLILASPGKGYLGYHTVPKRTFLGDPGSFMVSGFRGPGFRA
jgi:hypothetical protein